MMRAEELAGLRQVAYNLLGRALVYPGRAGVEALSAAAAGLSLDGPDLSPFDFFSSWERVLNSLTHLPALEVLQAEYIRVFMHSCRRTLCQPYESRYVANDEESGWLAVTLEREYAAEGLALSSSANELPDHIAVELEFMATLCGREVDCWRREARAEGVVVLDAEASFLRRHLGLWVSAWASQVSRVDTARTYAVVVDAVREFVAHDCDLVHILRDRLGVPVKGDSKGNLAIESDRRLAYEARR